MKNILVVNVNWVGDVIFSSPVFRALKDAYPEAKISCLAVPRVRPVLQAISEIDEIIIFDEKGKHWTPWGKAQLIWELRRHKFDVAFLLHGSLTRALLVFFAGIRQRVGYSTNGRGRFLTHRISPLKENLHRSDHYLNVIESFGIPVEDRQTTLEVDPDAAQEVEKFLEMVGVKQNHFVVVVNPGGNWDLKRWPSDNWACLIERLTAQENKVVISGAAKDEDLVKGILSKIMVSGNRVPVSLAGKTTLPQMIALMKRANLVISADSGPLHMASSVGTPVIGIFGPTRQEVTGPRGPGRVTILQREVGCNREPCYHLECPDNICMQAVSVEDVLNAVGDFCHVG